MLNLDFAGVLKQRDMMSRLAVFEASLPILPADVVQNIFEHLSMTDVCNVAMSGRMFLELTHQMSTVYLQLCKADKAYVSKRLDSFYNFIERRVSKGMQVMCLIA